eukprot:1160895-Pelagomonas_calceolata.AAC.1
MSARVASVTRDWPTACDSGCSGAGHSCALMCWPFLCSHVMASCDDIEAKTCALAVQSVVSFAKKLVNMGDKEEQDEVDYLEKKDFKGMEVSAWEF